MNISKVDIVCGLGWGDEAKGKIVSTLIRKNEYNFVCRWAGGSNAGHTIYIDGKKYKTHIVPTGVFYNISSIIGPGCVINYKHFMEEINYLRSHGFNTDVIKVSPRAHVVMDEHLNVDKKKYVNSQGSTSKGIAPCYRDKYARMGVRVSEIDEFKPYLWDEKLYGNVLCEGAQGFWLDIDYGYYPFVTSSHTLPYAACSLGFSPKLINDIYGGIKIYDTRSGIDPEFPKSLFNDEDLNNLAILGNEIGVTTGRRRKVNWLNLDKLVEAINISGTNKLIISKIDVMEEYNKFKLYYNNNLVEFNSITSMKEYIEKILYSSCTYLKCIYYSSNPETF